MKVSNGYVWSTKYKAWRKLPRRAWLKIQRSHILKATKKGKTAPTEGKDAS